MKIKGCFWKCCLLLVMLPAAYYLQTKFVENKASRPSSKIGKEIAKTCERGNERYVEGKLVYKNWSPVPTDFVMTDEGAYLLMFDIKYTHNDFELRWYGYKSELDKQTPDLTIGEKYAFCAEQSPVNGAFRTKKFHSLSE